MADSLKDKISKTAATNDESVPRFLRTVFQILEDQVHTDYICWSQDGRAVMIKNPISFAQDLLPVYFKHSNYTSFVRQLNLYAFRKQKNYPYDNAFAHNMFVRGKKELLKFIKRKGYGAKGQNDNQVVSAELSEEEPRYEEVAEQNRCFKQVNKDITDKLSQYEEQTKEISLKNDHLLKQIQKKEHTEIFLKRLISKVTKVYGFDNIKMLVESVKSDMQKLEPKDILDHSIEKEIEDLVFYDNLFARKVSTASTQADMSEISLYPFLSEKPMYTELEHPFNSSDHNIWPEEIQKLGGFLPRADSDFGIAGLNSGKANFFSEKPNSFFTF